MRQLLCYVAVACLAVWAWGADTSTATKKKTNATQKKTGAATAHKSAPAKSSAGTRTTAAGARKTASTAKSSTTKSSTARKGAKTAAARKPATTWRNRQLTPTPDRYREIQSALVARGYLNSEAATGVWNENSIEAMKKFQAEQNLDPNGKINSLSLIALGLGPKHDTPSKPAENPQ